MDAITTPYHLVLPAIFCVFALVLILLNRKKLFGRHKVFWISATVFFVLYLLILSEATYYDIYCQWDLNRYDLNDDGIFSGSEFTAEQEAAEKRLISDTGRNLSFITGFVFAFVIALIVYLSGWFISKIKGE